MDIQDVQGKKASGIRSTSEKTIGLLRRFLPVHQRRAFAYARLKREYTEENHSNGDDEECKEDEEEIEGNIKIKRRIKRHPFRNSVVKKNLEIKKKKSTNKSSQIKKLSKVKAKASISTNALVLRDPKDRWSTGRYKMAEKNLTGVMESKKATSVTPPQMRTEARKNPTKDARELKILKDAMNKMERDFNETKLKLEDEVERLRREVGELSGFKKRMEEENKQPIKIAGSSPYTMGQLDTTLDSSKCDIGSALVLPAEMCEEQFVKETEEKLVSSPEKSLDAESPHKSILTTSTTTPNKDQLLNSNKEKENAAKIEDNNSDISTGSNQVMVKVEATTPPSVHSSIAPALPPPPPPHNQLLAANSLAKNPESAADLINFNTDPTGGAA